MARGERTIKVKFDGSSAGLVAAAVAARASIKDLADDSKKRGAALKEFRQQVGGVGESLFRLAGGAANIGTALAAIPAVASSVSTLAGVTPLAVAGMFTLVGVLGAVKLGADGAKKAFAGLTPTLNTLKSNVSSSFESSLNPAVNNLQVVLPRLTSGFEQVATAVGGLATRVTAMLKTAAATSQVQAILSGTAIVVKNIGSFLTPIIAAFIRIGAVAMPILVQLTSHIGAAGEKFNAFIQKAGDDGKLAAWINNAIALFGKIFQAIGRFASLAAGIFGPLLSSGQAAAGGLSAAFALVGLKLGGLPGLIVGTIIPALSTFSKTPMGQQTLADLASAFTTVSAVVTGVLTKAFQTIAPLIDPLVKLFVNLVTTVGSALIPVLDFLAPVIQNIATFISQNIGWISPLVTALGIWTAAQWLLNIALDANPIGLVVLAIGVLIAIVATIITYWGPISRFFVGLWNTVKDAVTVAAMWVWQRLVDAWNIIKGVWSSVAGWFSGVWRGIIDGVLTVVRWIGQRFSDAWNVVKTVWSAVTGFFDAIWNAIKLPLMILGRIIEFVFLATVLAIKTTWNGLVAVFQVVWNAIAGPVMFVGQLIGQVFSAAWGVIQTIWSGIVAFFQPIWNALVTGFTILGQIVGQIWALLWAGIQIVWSVVVAFFQNIWSGITLAVTIMGQVVSQVFSVTWGVVRAVWSVVSGFFGGIWNGITGGVSAAAKWVGDRFSDAWNFIKSVWGQVSGFFSGIWSGIGNGLKSALNSVIRLINGAIGKVNTVTGVVGLPGIPEIPYLAKGGTARASRPYVVGEKGPELFVPGQTGRVVSNSQSFGGGSDITLNLDLGEGIRQVVQVHIDQNNRATWRTVKAGGRA